MYTSKEIQVKIAFRIQTYGLTSLMAKLPILVKKFAKIRLVPP